MDYAEYLRKQKEQKENPSAAPTSVVIELRAGTGGNEASIFAHDLESMYLKYAERHGWKTRVIDDLTFEKDFYEFCALLKHHQIISQDNPLDFK